MVSVRNILTKNKIINGRRGSVLIAVISVMALIFSLAITAQNYVTSESYMAANYADGIRAEYLSESAFQYAVQKLTTGSIAWLTEQNGTQLTITQSTINSDPTCWIAGLLPSGGTIVIKVGFAGTRVIDYIVVQTTLRSTLINVSRKVQFDTSPNWQLPLPVPNADPLAGKTASGDPLAFADTVIYSKKVGFSSGYTNKVTGASVDSNDNSNTINWYKSSVVKFSGEDSASTDYTWNATSYLNPAVTLPAQPNISVPTAVTSGTTVSVSSGQKVLNLTAGNYIITGNIQGLTTINASGNVNFYFADSAYFGQTVAINQTVSGSTFNAYFAKSVYVNGGLTASGGNIIANSSVGCNGSLNLSSSNIYTGDEVWANGNASITNSNIYAAKQIGANGTAAISNSLLDAGTSIYVGSSCVSNGSNFYAAKNINFQSTLAVNGTTGTPVSSVFQSGTDIYVGSTTNANNALFLAGDGSYFAGKAIMNNCVVYADSDIGFGNGVVITGGVWGKDQVWFGNGADITYGQSIANSFVNYIKTGTPSSAASGSSTPTWTTATRQ